MIRIEFFGKNWPLSKRVDIESQYVPRVGELIYAGRLVELSDDEPHNFFVTKVIYEATDTGIIPVVTCQQWYKGSRQEELESRGWLPNPGWDLIYDDEE